MPHSLSPNVLSWVPQEQIEDAALQQIHSLAEMPFIFKHVAVMPDCHFGLGATVGSCIPTRGAIIPAAVGVDIGCGMIAAKTDMTAADLPDDLADIRKAIEHQIPLSAGRYNRSVKKTAKPRIEQLEARAEELGRLEFYNKVSKNWRKQLGSLGSGNHFIEVVLDEDDSVWAFLHSGSRGVGNRIATHHIKIAKSQMERDGIPLPDADLAYLSEGTPEFDDYITDLDWAQEFALLNREEMMERILRLDAVPLRRVRGGGADTVPPQLHAAREPLRRGHTGVAQRRDRGTRGGSSDSYPAPWARAATSCAAGATRSRSTPRRTEPAAA